MSHPVIQLSSYIVTQPGNTTTELTIQCSSIQRSWHHL